MSIDLSVLVAMNEDADDSWYWTLFENNIVASVDFFEMSVVVYDVNDGVYWVVEDSNDDWLPEINFVYINIVETGKTIVLVVIDNVL